MHCHGHRLERPCQRRHPVCSRTGCLQLHLPGIAVLGLRLSLYSHIARLVWTSRERQCCTNHYRTNRKECVYLSRDSFHYRIFYKVYPDQGKEQAMVRNQVCTKDKSPDTDSAIVYHHRNVLSQGRIHCENSNGCSPDCNTADHLFPGHVCALILHE